MHGLVQRSPTSDPRTSGGPWAWRVGGRWCSSEMANPVLMRPTQVYNDLVNLGSNRKAIKSKESVASGRIQPLSPRQLSWALISCFPLETCWSRSSDEARLACKSPLWRPNILRLTTAGFFYFSSSWFCSLFHQASPWKKAKLQSSACFSERVVTLRDLQLG